MFEHIGEMKIVFTSPRNIGEGLLNRDVVDVYVNDYPVGMITKPRGHSAWSFESTVDIYPCLVVISPKLDQCHARVIDLFYRVRRAAKGEFVSM